MTVYAEIVFIENFFADLFLFTATLTVLKRRERVRRLILCAAFFALVSAVLPLILQYAVYVKIACIVAIPFCIRKNKSFGTYLLTSCVFLSLTLTLGGAVYALKRCLVGYFPAGTSLQSGLVALVSIASLCVLVLLKEIVKNGKRESCRNAGTYRVVIYCNDIKCDTEGFFDSGNKVYAKNGDPVTILDYALYNRFCAEETSVLVGSVGGSKRLLAKEASVRIYLPTGENILYKTQIASAPDLTVRAGVLLHGDVFGG